MARKTFCITKTGARGKFFKAVAVAFLISSCAPSEKGVSAQNVAQLPIAHANNAVAVVEVGGVTQFYSFNGLRAGKTHEDVSHQAIVCVTTPASCEEIVGPPVSDGRLASVAVTVNGEVYLFGGYTVAPDGAEISTPELFAFNPEDRTYRRLADMPTPVDDAVAFSYLDRYIYLVSGWHNDGNVSLVQVYDIQNNNWFRATDYPGAPVFGHAGGAVGGKFVIADGVAVVGVKDGHRQFGAVDEVWFGEIDANDPALISWRMLSPHPGGPLYRMAATGDEEHNRIVFYGGADNPYNFDGIGYDGMPANPSDLLFAYDIEGEKWINLGRSNKPSMDHRALMIAEGDYWVLGGMNNERAVIGDLLRLTLAD